MNEITQKSAYHHGNLRAQLIAATRELIEEKGPDGFSVTEASRAAGVSSAAPYKHFSDRNDLMRAVCLEGFAEMGDDFRTAVQPHVPGSVDALTALGVAYVRFAERNPGLFRMMFAIAKDTEETEAAGYTCYSSVLEQVAASMGRRDVDHEVFRAAFPLWTYVHGLAFLRIDGKAEFAKVDGTPLDEIVRFASERLLGPFPIS